MLSSFAEKAAANLGKRQRLKVLFNPALTSCNSRICSSQSKSIQTNVLKSNTLQSFATGRTFSSSRSPLAHPRLVLSEEQEMECVAVPTMFHLGRAIKTVNLLRNLDKFGRPLGVAVSEDAPGTSDMLEAVDVLPNRSLTEILEAEAIAGGQEMDKRAVTAPVLANYPLPTDEIPGQFKSSAWRQWYSFLEENVWHKQTPARKAQHTTTGTSTPPTRDAFMSTMRAALTQAVQHFPSVLSGSIPLERSVGGQETKSKSWLRIGQAYFDVGSLSEGAINDILSMRSDEIHYEEKPHGTEARSRQYPAEEFKWIHFSPEDPRLLYMNQPPPLSLIYQQLEKHLLLTQNFTLVPHQLEVYGEGVETLPRFDPLDPNFLGTVIIALPTTGCVGGSIKLTNLNHTSHQGAAEVPEEDLSKIDSDLSRVLSNLDLQHGNASTQSNCPPEPFEIDLDRIESDFSSPPALSGEEQAKLQIGDPGHHAETVTGRASKCTSTYQNWSSFTWSPFGGEQTSISNTTVRTGRGELSVPTLQKACEPSGLSWIAFSKNIPYCVEKVESGNRVLLAYHIIGKNSTNTSMQQPTQSDIQMSASAVPHMSSELNLPLVNALFSPRMRQAGISKLVSLVAYYFNHAQKGSWLSHGEDDLTSIGIALRDTYAPELLEAEQLVGSDMWLYNVFKWACSQQSGIFDHPMRLLLAPIAMIHQGQLGESHRKVPHTIQSPPDKQKSSAKGKLGKDTNTIYNAGEKDSGPHRWETQEHNPPSNLVYFLNLEGWEHEGPVLAHDAYFDCARYSSLPARPLSTMERTIYGTDHHPSNSQTEWHSIPILYGQRWGEELDSWEPAPIINRNSPTKKDTKPESFHVVGRKTFATTALIIQKIQKESENQL